MPTPNSTLPEEMVREVAAPATLPEQLAAVISAVRTDSQQQPTTYLDETVVPFGGE